jgi:hypothetical protein
MARYFRAVSCVAWILALWTGCIIGADSGDAGSGGVPSKADGSSPDAGGTPLDAGSRAGFVIISPVQLDKSSYAPGETIQAQVRYQNQGAAPISVATLVITCRAPGTGTLQYAAGDNFLPSLTNLVVQPSETVNLSASRTVGSSDALGAWSVYSTWQDLRASGTTAQWERSP